MRELRRRRSGKYRLDSPRLRAGDARAIGVRESVRPPHVSDSTVIMTGVAQAAVDGAGPTDNASRLVTMT
jgi:hypothetical protein